MKAKWLLECEKSFSLDDTFLDFLRNETISQARIYLAQPMYDLHQDHKKALEDQVAEFNEEIRKIKENHKVSMSSTINRNRELEDEVVKLRRRCCESMANNQRVERVTKKRKIADAVEKVAQ